MSLFSSLLIMFIVEPGETPWYSIPGFEIWRLFNLAFFLVVMYLILRRPLSTALQSRRENIRRELTRAKEERDAALAKLEEVEKRLTHLTSEVATIEEHAQREASEERERIKIATEEEIKRLREQTQREIKIAGNVARQDLRRYAADQSVQLAEEMLRREIRPEDDARLMSGYLDNLGGVGK